MTFLILGKHGHPSASLLRSGEENGRARDVRGNGARAEIGELLCRRHGPARSRSRQQPLSALATEIPFPAGELVFDSTHSPKGSVEKCSFTTRAVFSSMFISVEVWIVIPRSISRAATESCNEDKMLSDKLRAVHQHSVQGSGERLSQSHGDHPRDRIFCRDSGAQ